MLVDRTGKVVHSANNLVDRELPKLVPLLAKLLGEGQEIRAVKLEGVAYRPATLERSGETQAPRRRERFPSLACAEDGRVYLAFTSNRNGNSDVFVRVFDGKSWSSDGPVAATQADEYDAAVVLDRKGRRWLSWTSNADAKNYNIFVAAVTDPSEPIKPTQLTRADDDAMHARMACDRNGRVWATYYRWHKMGPNSRDKEAYARWHDGGKWSEEIRVSPTDVPTYEDHTDPTITAYGEGVAVAWSWDFHRPAGYTRKAREPTIFLRTIEPEGPATREGEARERGAGQLKLSRPRALSAGNIDTTPALAVGRDGRIWCAWDSLGWDVRTGAYQKGLHVRACAPTGTDVHPAGEDLSGGVRNVCTPCFAVSPTGVVTLVWAQCASADQWMLKRADFDPKATRWSEPETIVSKGKPRFPSAAYDNGGDLWIAYSAQTPSGREIVAKEIQAEPGRPDASARAPDDQR